jgi:hypothetical protein
MNYGAYAALTRGAQRHTLPFSTAADCAAARAALYPRSIKRADLAAYA